MNHNIYLQFIGAESCDDTSILESIGDDKTVILRAFMTNLHFYDAVSTISNQHNLHNLASITFINPLFHAIVRLAVAK